MTVIYKDRVKETTTTTGTGTVTLLGAVAGHRTFASSLNDGDAVTYCIEDGTDWEVGEGTFTASGSTLSRSTVVASSNGNAAVNWGAGTKNVFLTLSARDVAQLPFPNLDVVAGARADNGTTENGAPITAYLATMGPGTAILGTHGGANYAINHPVIIPNGVALTGMGSMQGGTTLQATSSFPHTTSSSSQATAANTTTTFTLNVASTTNFPLGSGGITPASGIAVLCMDSSLGYPITVFYTGTTPTSFTGCRVGASDVNATVASGADVSTFMVWLTDPGDTGGFGTRIENIGIDCNGIAGVSGIHSSHLQEGGGVHNVRIWKYKVFGIRFDSNPSSAGDAQVVNHDVSKLWVIASSTPVANCIGIDFMFSKLGAGTGKIDATRGIRDVTFTAQGSSVAVGRAHVRLNAATGRYADMHFECGNIGVLVGDVYPCSVTIENVNISGAWGANDSPNALVTLWNTPFNCATITNANKSDWVAVPNRVVLRDLVNGMAFVDNIITSYVLTTTGEGRKDGGGPYPTLPNIRAAQDNIASGAMNAVLNGTMVVTFTKTTTVGNHAILAVTTSNDRVVSSIADSRGNTWQVDVTEIGQGPAVSIASCHITVGHQISDTLTLTLSGLSEYGAAIASEWSNIATTSWLDRTQVNMASAGLPSTGPTAERTQNKELLFGAISYTNATDQTPGNSFTALTGNSSGAGLRKIFPEYKIVSGKGTEPATFAQDLNNYDVAIATYKAGTGSTLYGKGDGSWETLPSAAADGVTTGVATFTAADFNAAGGVISLDYTNGQKATGSIPGFLSAADWTTFNGKISATDAAADGATKGLATFVAADFNATSGVISLDYTNGQKATASVPGFLSAADWTTFNGKFTATDAGADDATKGVAGFTAADFNAASGIISLDYANGQKASGSVPGFLSSTDWTTFNGKVSTTIATDPVWAAAGDVVIGTGTATAAKLAIGTAAGKALVADPNATNKASIQFPQGIYEALGGTTGCLAATFDRGTLTTTQSAGAATSGTLRLFRILLPKGLPVTNISFWAGATPLGTGTHQWFGLFDSSRVVLAKTADDTSTAWSANAKKTLAVTSGPFVTTYAGWHYVGILITVSGGAVPTIEAIGTLLTTGIRDAEPKCGGNSTVSLTDPASCTGTQTAITSLAQLAYAEIS